MFEPLCSPLGFISFEAPGTDDSFKDGWMYPPIWTKKKNIMHKGGNQISEILSCTSSPWCETCAGSVIADTIYILIIHKPVQKPMHLMVLPIQVHPLILICKLHQYQLDIAKINPPNNEVNRDYSNYLILLISHQNRYKLVLLKNVGLIFSGGKTGWIEWEGNRWNNGEPSFGRFGHVGEEASEEEGEK